MSELESRRPSLTSRIAHVLRPKKSKNPQLNSEPKFQLVQTKSQRDERLDHGNEYKKKADVNLCEQTGERRDDTAILHGLSHYGSFDSLDSNARVDLGTHRPRGERDIEKLSSEIWRQITKYLSCCDVICLATSSKTLLRRTDKKYWYELKRRKNQEEKIRYLMTMDGKYPDHLLCFSCAVYHRRTKIGNESVKSAMVLNPLYNCDGYRKFGYIQPKTRLTPGHFLPFTFVQLVTRAQKYSPRYGIPLVDLCRRYKEHDRSWFHETRYHIYNGHLFLRVTSRTFAAAGLPASAKRHVLYSREDYWPYFSCCTHWRDGELLDVCKCALSHIPDLPNTNQKGNIHMRQRTQNSSLIGTLCSFCRPMRRCPKCPTEYMVELKISEDKVDPQMRFKQSLVVTRWSDLGDGSSPFYNEWQAINEDTDYDSFAHMGKRAISCTFEAESGVNMAAQRLISTNPKNEKRGEEGDSWY
ncbi:putative f-box domain protein [Golovinomyces cichoracearum]|uniref:Putative f-box domain protein n=1 Tax=Golovinomyces cichoracearum TaxID=62708 RepID=A0A420H8P7_9PEZI|nr:putative f-box domain protein [Golovinomyces cichoracearum]